MDASKSRKELNSRTKLDNKQAAVSPKKSQPAAKDKSKTGASDKAISDIYVHKVPLFERWQKSYESKNVAKSYEKLRMEEIKDRMRRFEIAEISEHSKRFDNARKDRQHNQSKLMDDKKMDPELVKFMKEYKERNNEIVKDKQDKSNRRQEMLNYVKDAKERQMSAVEQKRFNRGLNYNSQQNLYLQNKAKMIEKVEDYKKYIKSTLDPLRKEQRDKLLAKTPRAPTALSSIIEPSSVMSQVKSISARPTASASQIVIPKVANYDEVKTVENKLKNLQASGEGKVQYVNLLSFRYHCWPRSKT